MAAIKLQKIIFLGSLFVAVKGLWVDECCTLGHLYRDKSGTIRCVDIGIPTYINKKTIPVKLSLAQCRNSIEETTTNIGCIEGETCSSALYDEESKLVIRVQVEFSKNATEEWIPFTDVPRSKVKICDPESIGPHKIFNNNNFDIDLQEFGQTYQKDDFVRLNCPIKDQEFLVSGYFIEDEFVNSPLSDHPMVLYLKKKVESINYCVYNSKGYAVRRMGKDPEFGPYAHLTTCLNSERGIFDALAEALVCIEGVLAPVQQTMFKNLLVCSSNNKFHRKTTLERNIMIASPLELGDGIALLEGLNLLGDHNQIIAGIINDNGTESSYWRKNERKMYCMQGIRKLENVTIGIGAELYSNGEKISTTENICLSSTNDNGLDAYVCQGYSEHAVEEDLQH